MKIELSNGVVVIPTPELETDILVLLFGEVATTIPMMVEQKPQLETKLSAKFRRKFEEKTETKKRKGGYTEEQENAIIAMVNNGIGPTEIAKKLQKSMPAISNKISKMKEAGLIKEKSKQSLPAEDEEDGYKSL